MTGMCHVWRGGVGSRGSSGGEFVEHVERIGQAALTVGVEFADARREPGRLPPPRLLEQGLAFGGDGHPADPAVRGVGRAGHEAVALQLGDHLRDRRGSDPFVLGEGAQGERTVVGDDGQGRLLARREAGAGLLAEPAGQPRGAQPQPGGDLGGSDGSAGGRRRGAHARYFTRLIS